MKYLSETEIHETAGGWFKPIIWAAQFILGSSPTNIDNDGRPADRPQDLDDNDNNDDNNGGGGGGC